MIAVGAVNLLQTFFIINIVLGVFNLLPIPPLDGSGILASLLPSSFEEAMDQFQQFGYLLLFVAVFTGVIGKILGVVIPLVWSLVFFGAQ
jgi:Zn-dependent protease